MKGQDLFYLKGDFKKLLLWSGTIQKIKFNIKRIHQIVYIIQNCVEIYTYLS